MRSLENIDPYKVSAGPELDTAIHQFLFQQPVTIPVPPYSTNLQDAEKVRVKFKAAFGLSIVIGRTRLRDKPWFARYDADPSTSTEVLAETSALAICRLALVRVTRETD